MRLNHQVASRLPGNGDDAVFNFLRLQPGIMAAGEQSSEMIIWGDYSGNSQLLFDGFTVFGPRNFNDNISFVNPYMAKEIRVLKGGYSAEYGDRVGGIVEITGIEGNRERPDINLNINNNTLSGMASFPLAGSAAITAAFRHTYYNIIDVSRLGIISDRGDESNLSSVDVTVAPDYRFRDGNLKYAGSTRQGDRYFVSLYTGGDLFSYVAEEERERVRIIQENIENNRQSGGTAFYGKTWKSGTISNFSLSYSGLTRNLFESQEIKQRERDIQISFDESQYISSVSEVKFINRNDLNIWEKHDILAGGGYIYNANTFLLDLDDVIYPDGFKHAGRLHLFIQDTYHPVPSITVTPGLRIDHMFQRDGFFIQPRFACSVRLTDFLKINTAWGIYNQFITKASLLDDLGNYRYFWIISDHKTVPVLQAQHVVGGIVLQHGGFTLSVEPFLKMLNGLTRVLENNGDSLDHEQGRAKIYGIDFLMKQYIGRHEAWVSYTLGRTEEHFSYFETGSYTDAPQDQRHEVKGAMLFDFEPFFLAANYVYGSGLAYGNALVAEADGRYPYSRLDASFIYRVRLKDVRIETGISLLNILNRENIKYSNFFEVPDGEFSSISIHAEAVPFTPTIYANFSF